MVDAQGIELPKGVCAGLTDAEREQLFAASVVHEKPLVNALGAAFKSVLTKDRVRRLFERM
ncbi:MAG: hypothetical protein VW338_17305, partial [Rhodospirillaceae bacterium]